MSTPFYISYVALWILVIFQSLVLLGLVRMVYQLQQRGAAGGSSAGDITSGQEAPSFSSVDLSGVPINSTSFAGRLTALLFVSPTCPSCTTTLHELNALRHKAHGNVIVICRAAQDDCMRLAEVHQLNMPVVADEDDQISRLYGIAAVPTAVLINAHNQIQSYGQPVREELAEVFATAPAVDVQEVA